MSAKKSETTVEMPETASVEIAIPNRPTEEQLRSLTSFDDALKLAATLSDGNVVNAAEELGTGFALLKTEDKMRLVGVPLIIVSWDFIRGDHSELYASAKVVTTTGEKYIVNDSGAGIFAQLKEYSRRTGRFAGMLVPNGLDESVYDTCMECNKPNPINNDECPHCGDTGTRRGKGTTYYLNLTK